MKSIVKKLTHNEDKTKDFFKFHLTKVHPSRYYYYGVFLILIIVSLFFIFRNDFGSFFFFLFVAFMVLIIKKVVTNIMAKNISKKVIYKSINYELELSENEITYKDAINKEVYPWLKIKFICEVNRYYYFYVTNSSALILNKYTLTENERKELSDFLSNLKIKYKKYNF